MDQSAHGGRVLGLDIFRAAAIILVVLLHGRFILDGTVLERFPFVRIVDGVELFFVLSGFLIGGILLKRINGTETFSIHALFEFWKRRWFRTLPAYYLVLVINYIVVRANVIHEGIGNFNWRYIFFLQNFTKPILGFFRESWSLSIEEWFYLTMPVMLLILIRFTKPKVAFIIATMIMIVFSFLCRTQMMDAGFDRFWLDLNIRKVVVTRLDGIGYGLLAAWICYYYPTIWERIRYYAFGIGIALLTFVVSYRAPVSGFYRQVAYYSLYPIAAMLLLPLASAVRSGGGMVARALIHISRISYSMYLINLAIVAEVIRDQFTPQGGIDGIVKYIFYWVIVVMASTVLYYSFEKPMMELREKK